MHPILVRLSAGWRWYALALLAVLALSYYALAVRDGGPGASLSVERKDVPTEVRVSGTVKAAENVDLGFAASGRIAGVYASVGQHVRAGALLAETENGDLVAAVAQKKAALDEALAGTRAEEVAVKRATVEGDKAKLAEADTAVQNALLDAYTKADDAVRGKTDQFMTNPTSLDIALSFFVPDDSLMNRIKGERLALEPILSAWGNSLSASSSDAELARAADSGRARLIQVRSFLVDVGSAINDPDAVTASTKNTSASQPIPSSWKTDVSTARANVESALSALSSARSSEASAAATLDEDQKDLALSLAGSRGEDIEAAKADLENARAALGKTRIVAPFDGIVTRMDAKVGQVISPSDTEIAMQSDGVFEMETYVPEVSIAGVSSGDAATSTLDAYGPSVEFPARVILVDPAETVKDGVPTYKTTLVFLGEDPRIRSGMTANLRIETGVLRNAVVIPQGAVGQDASGAYVSVLSDGKTARRKVQLGASPALGQVEVVSGLEAGDRISLSPTP